MQDKYFVLSNPCIKKKFINFIIISVTPQNARNSSLKIQNCAHISSQQIAFELLSGIFRSESGIQDRFVSVKASFNRHDAGNADNT